MTATVYSGAVRYFRQGSRRITRSRRREAILWCCVLAIGAFFALNWIYQVIRKPGEIFSPVSAALSKSHESTWQSYGPLFERYSTSILSAEFLAALAQVEGDGNPIATTYWRWEWSWNPFEIYRPASSALGMFQITDGTFVEARKYCIRHHKVVTNGPWYDPSSCWFNNLYSRIIPSHSIEMTAAYLHQSAMNTLAARRVTNVTSAQKEKLAAVIHLCGAKRGEALVGRGFRVNLSDRCGSHNLRGYLAKVERAKLRFARLRRAAELLEP